MDVLAFFLSWFGLLCTLAVLSYSAIRTLAYWTPGATHQRKLALAKPARKELGRNLTTTILLALSFVGFILQYAPALVGRSELTLWSALLGHEIRSNLTLEVLIVLIACCLVFSFLTAEERWPQVLSANLWVIGLLVLDLTIITTLALVLALGPLQIIGLVVVSLALPFHGAAFYLLRAILNWARYALRGIVAFGREVVLFGLAVGREVGVLIRRASDVFREFFLRSESAVQNLGKSSRELALEERLDEAETKERVGDETLFRPARPPWFKRASRNPPSTDGES